MKGEKIELEDLLKLKRCEKPSQVEWSKFDAELRRKMMVSIVDKESFLQKVITFVSDRRAMASGAIAGAFVVAVAVILTFPESETDKSATFDDSFASATPLPKVATVYAEGRIVPSGISPVENSLSFQMGSGDVSYVAHDVAPVGLSAF